MSLENEHIWFSCHSLAQVIALSGRQKLGQVLLLVLLHSLALTQLADICMVHSHGEVGS